MKASVFSGLYYRFIEIAVKLCRTGKKVGKFSNFVSALRGKLSSSRNHLYNEHLKRIFPEHDQAWRDSILEGYWRVHERNLFALFYLKNKIFNDIKSNVTWIGRELLDSAFDCGKGILLLVPHFGDERSLHVILGMEGYPVDVITSSYTDMPKHARDCRLGIGKKWNNLHFPSENPRWMFRTLTEGRILHYASTAYGGPAGTWIASFGVPALVPSSPWKLWKRTDCKILLGSCRQTPEMGFNLQFSEITPGASKEEFAQLIAKETEKLAATYPDQYEWKNLLIRHRETNTIKRIGKIPVNERELEKLAEYSDADPLRILSLTEILDSLR